MMKIILPYPPSVNRFWMSVATMTERYRVTGKLKDLRIITFPTSEAKEYMQQVRKIFLASQLPKLGGDIELHMIFFRPQRSGDLDNFFKAPIDALKNFAFFDDKHIVRIIAERHEDPRNPRVEIEILPVGLFAEQMSIQELLPL